MMASSDITNRLIQQNRPVEEFHQPAYENLHTGANRLFTRAFFAAIERDFIRGRRRRREIASLARLRLSPFEIFAQRQLQPFLTPIFDDLSGRPLTFVPTVRHHQPAHRTAIVLALSYCVGAFLPNQGAGKVVPAPDQPASRYTRLRPAGWCFAALARSVALWQGSARSVEPFSADSLV
jgi:hypothetical protein